MSTLPCRRVLQRALGSALSPLAIALALSTSTWLCGQSTRPTLPLHVWAYEGELRGVQDRLTRGDRIDSTDDDGATPLHWAARPYDRTAEQARMVEFLLSRGADANAKDKIGRTPLHAAADGGNVRAAELLIKAGAGVDEVTVYGRTPLHQAALRGNTNLAQLLVAAGADATRANPDGETPIGLAVKHQQWNVVEVLARALKGGGAASRPSTHPASTTRAAGGH